VSKLLQDPTAAPLSVTTGGKFADGAADIGTLNLQPGMYLINVQLAS
jgi:hypothetical protein